MLTTRRACRTFAVPTNVTSARAGHVAPLAWHAPRMCYAHKSCITCRASGRRSRLVCVSAAPEMSQQRKPANEDVEGSMLDPSLANKNTVRALCDGLVEVRLLAVAAAVLLTARSSQYWSGQAGRTVHLLAYGTWLGSLIWTTFFAGITMFKNLPRQVFGRLQSKLFPLYFMLAIACLVLQLGTLAFGPGSGVAQQQLVTLGIALVASLANGFLVEPKATESMFKRYELENQDVKDAERIKALRSEFGKLHGLSSTLNLAAVVTAVSHGWWLASRIALSAI